MSLWTNFKASPLSLRRVWRAPDVVQDDVGTGYRFNLNHRRSRRYFDYSQHVA